MSGLGRLVLGTLLAGVLVAGLLLPYSVGMGLAANSVTTAIEDAKADPLDGQIPLFYMIGLLSREKDKDPRESRHSMVRYAEPLLDTFGVPHARLEGPDDVKLIPEYYRLSRERRGPAVVLVGLATS